MTMKLSRKISYLIGFILLITLATTLNAVAQQDATAIVEKSLKAFYYAGDTLSGRATMRLISGSNERVQEIRFLRRNANAKGDQKYFVYFNQPADVKGTTVLLLKYTDKDADRFICLPALNVVRRVSAKDRNSKFVGSDFSFDDVSGHSVGEDTHTIEKDQGTTYLIKSVPKNLALSDYAYKLTVIDKKTYLPMDEKRFNKDGKLLKEQTLEKIVLIKGLPTALKRTMKDLVSNHTSEFSFTKLDYNIPLDDGIFSERYLKQPPEIVLQ